MMLHPLHPTLYENPVLPYDYKAWYANYTWVHKQPFPLWLIAISYKVFGVSEFATRIPSILLSSLSIIFTFLICANLFDKKKAILAAWFHATNGLIIETAAGRVSTDHYDCIFLVLIELAIWLVLIFEKKEKYWHVVFSAIMIAVAVLTKWLPAFIIYPIWVTLILYFNKGATITSLIKKKLPIIFLHFLIVLFIAGSWQLFIIINFPKESLWEYKHNILHITSVLDNQQASWYYYVEKLSITCNEFFLIVMCYVVYKVIKEKGERLVYTTLLVWIIIPLLFFSFAQTKMQAYILFVFPGVFILIADFFYNIKSNQTSKWSNTCMVFLKILIICLPLRYSIERLKIFEDYDRNPKWVEDLKKIKNKYPTDKTIIFNYPKPIEAMFYTGYTVYNQLPDSQYLAKIKSNGCNILIYSSKNTYKEY